MNIKYLILAAVSGALITIDQLAKMFVHTHFTLGESVQVIENFFSLTYVRNTGAAFGIFGESHPLFREIFFLSMPPIAVLVILTILRGVSERDRVNVVALSLIFGGAIGNYIDRLRFRYVIDFLDFHLANQYTWPAFNVADMGIVCGVATLIFLEFSRKSANAKQATT